MTNINEIRQALAEPQGEWLNTKGEIVRFDAAVTENAPTWLAELCDENEALKARAMAAEAKLAERDNDAANIAAERDAYQEEVTRTAAKLAEVERALNQAVYEGDKAKAERERDAAIAERDARPNVSAADAACLEWHLHGPPYRDDDAGMIRLWNAMQAHAKASGGGHG